MKLTKLQKRNLIKAVVFLVTLCLGLTLQKPNSNDQPTPQTDSSQGAATDTHRVIRVSDGDTIVVDVAGVEESVRLIGVDTPETRDPRQPVQCFGQAASAFTKQLIADHPVRLEADPESSNRDRYNRLLRYVYLPSNTLVNAEIIRQGYGFAYTSFTFTKQKEFEQLEEYARQNNLGLWSACQPGLDERGSRTINPASTQPAS